MLSARNRTSSARSTQGATPFGDVLEVRLNPGEPPALRRTALDIANFTDAIGGTSLGVALLDVALAGERRTFDPLGPENAIVFAAGPFAHVAVPTAAKHAVVTISPLTGRVTDGLSSSHWSRMLRELGLAALIVRGRAHGMNALVIDGDDVRTTDASDLLGLSAAQTAAALRTRFGRTARVAAIGPAGERGVPYATIENDGRQAGRGGAGAVLASKGLKAIVLRGVAVAAPSTEPHDADGLATLAAGLRARMLGPGTAKYRTLGTGANLRALARMGMLPAKNFTTVAFSGVEGVSPERAREGGATYREIRGGCAGCPIQCEHMYVRRDGDASAAGASEYESVWAFGPNCGVDDLDAVLDAIARCDRYGLDTISTGATIAFAMECTERGVLRADLFDETLRFGNARALAPAIDAVAARAGEGGALLALGVRELARRLGPPAQMFAMHCKGLELPGYEPRALPTYALGLAVCTRGACHNRAAAYDRDLRDPEGAPHTGIAARARAVIAAEDDAILWDTLVLCKFTRHALGDLAELGTQLLAATYGVRVTRAELADVAARAWARKRELNRRLGWSAEEDVLPPRLFEPLADGPYAGRALARDSLAAERIAYEGERAASTERARRAARGRAT